MFSKVHIRFPLCFLHINPLIILKFMLLLFIIGNSIFNSRITWLLQLEKNINKWGALNLYVCTLILDCE